MRLHTTQGHLRWGVGGAAAPSALIQGGQEGQELPFVLNSFHLSYLLKGHFPAFQTVWFKKIFLGASPQTPKLPLNH